MKVVYFDCFSGISGDMIVGSFLDSGVPLEFLKEEINKLPLPHLELEAQKVSKKGISATKFNVKIPEEHVHRGLSEIKEIINGSSLSEFIKSKSVAIFTRLAEAEGRIHDKPADEIHFHEVGALDAIVDIVGATACLQHLKVEKVYASKIKVGSGTVECAHGILPVPVPAVLELLKGVPILTEDAGTEIVTPTGAAILSTLCSSYGLIPEMVLESTGYGAGSKDLPTPNILRVLIGEAKEEEKGLSHEEIYQIETNIDDMNPQFYGYVMGKLFEAGALDVYLTPIIMKKSRPATMLTALCFEKELQTLAEIIIAETSSIGVRFKRIDRLKASRKIEKIQTKYGEVRLKIAEVNGEIISRTPEYEDCVKLSLDNKIPLKRIYAEIYKAIA